MLNKLRQKKTAKKIWIILIILVLPAFLFWGFGSFMRSRQESVYVGKISGRKITSLEYRDALDAVRIQALIRFGDSLPEIQKFLNLEAQAWDRLALLAEAKKRKIRVSDKEIVETIKSYPFFQHNEQFDNKIYLELLRYVFYTQPRTFEEQTRQNLTLSKFYREITDKITVTEDEVKQEYQKLNEQISLYYIASLYSVFAKDITPSEEEINDYFKKNSFKFKEPLTYNLEYLSLNSEASEEETIKDNIKIILTRLNKKESFANVAKDFKLEVKETGLFRQTDPMPGIGWSGQILSFAEKAKVGDYLPPIKMDKYYYILRLKEKKDPFVPNLETIKEKVKEAFTKGKAQEIARQKIEDALKNLKTKYQSDPKSADFSEAAKLFDLESGSTELFKYGSYIEGIGASDKFFVQAKELKDGGFSEIIDMPFGFYIIKLNTMIPIDENKFSGEKNEFTQRLLLQKKEEFFAKFVEGLKGKAQRNF
ncbi:MAG: SurA N-terminal domain-containing protein [Candidatus Omnitrophica bacterium]|nr:SurA N-terminal domain-containing protein [Candidatus Omnitrophota bacterium]